MDEGSKEELRVYSLLQSLENRLYSTSELKRIFEFDCDLRQTRLYKYIRPILKKPSLELEGYKILQGELLTGNHLKDRKPVLRGKYKITAVIDGVHFTYMKRRSSLKIDYD